MWPSDVVSVIVFRSFSLYVAASIAFLLDRVIKFEQFVVYHAALVQLVGFTLPFLVFLFKITTSEATKPPPTPMIR